MKKYIAWIATIIFLAFMLYAYTSGVREYVWDGVLFIAITWALFYVYTKLHLTPVVYASLLIACMLHNAGVFGWYGNAPLPIQWDHVTHFVGLFAVALASFQFGKQFFKKDKMHNGLVLGMMLLAALGVGAVVEQIEYVGYLNLGEGEGLFYHGGLGDVGVNLRAMDEVGGGWLNAMIDLMYNFYGALAGILISLICYKKTKST